MQLLTDERMGFGPMEFLQLVFSSVLLIFGYIKLQGPYGSDEIALLLLLVGTAGVVKVMAEALPGKWLALTLAGRLLCIVLLVAALYIGAVNDYAKLALVSFGALFVPNWLHKEPPRL